VLRHDILDLAQLPASFVAGRTVLLGDAAHGMTPNLGQGAGQAIEDAATLTLLLRPDDGSDRSDPDVTAALARYDDLRRRRTGPIWSQSRLMGRVAQLANPIGAGLRDGLLRVFPPSLMTRGTRSLQRWTAP